VSAGGVDSGESREGRSLAMVTREFPLWTGIPSALDQLPPWCLRRLRYVYLDCALRIMLRVAEGLESVRNQLGSPASRDRRAALTRIRIGGALTLSQVSPHTIVKQIKDQRPRQYNAF